MLKALCEDLTLRPHLIVKPKLNLHKPWRTLALKPLSKARGFRKPKAYPKGPCIQIVHTLGPMYLYREYFKNKVYTIWIHGSLGLWLPNPNS